MKLRCFLILLIATAFVFPQSVFSGNDTLNPYRVSLAKHPFFRPAQEYNATRFYGVTGSILGIYGAALVGLNYAWYKGYERGSFHFFDDGKEWMGMDKVGHVYNSYYQSRLALGMYNWTGVSRKKAIWIGGMTGTFLQSSIEIMDAFSEKWGFSWWDFGANALGSAALISQELAWNDQRITIKLSAWPRKYPEDVADRARDLFGNNYVETVLKDYNSITGWASVNIGAFLPKQSKFPKWLNIAAGYGANGLFGGFENRWCEGRADLEVHNCPPELIRDRTDISRYPQFYLSPDIDFTKIKTRSATLRSLFVLLNIVKVPAPTLEFNPQNKVRFHWMFF